MRSKIAHGGNSGGPPYIILDMLYPWEKRQNVLATGVLANLPGSSRDEGSADALRQSRD